jgi:hypothetical protein
MIPIVGSKEEIKRRLIMIKSQKQNGVLASLATALALGALGCVGFTRAQDAAQPKTTDIAVAALPRAASSPGYIVVWNSIDGSTNLSAKVYDGAGAPITIPDGMSVAQWLKENALAGSSIYARRGNNGMEDLHPTMTFKPALPDSTEGLLKAQGKKWVPAPGDVRVGGYVEDTLFGRLDQPEGRGMIAKVISMDEYIGMEHAWVDFGHGWLSHIRTSELCPIRFVTNDSIEPIKDQLSAQADAAFEKLNSQAAFDSIEWQLNSEGKKWENATGPVRVGNYVQDKVSNRTNQPAGRGTIGKVISLDEFNGAEHAWVDFGRGWTTHIPTAELMPLRIIPGVAPAQTQPIQMNQYDNSSPEPKALYLAPSAPSQPRDQLNLLQHTSPSNYVIDLNSEPGREGVLGGERKIHFTKVTYDSILGATLDTNTVIFTTTALTNGQVSKLSITGTPPTPDIIFYSWDGPDQIILYPTDSTKASQHGVEGLYDKVEQKSAPTNPNGLTR